MRVQFDVLLHDGDRVGDRDGPAVEHLLEAVSERVGPVQHVEVALAARGVAEAVVVGYEVIGYVRVVVSREFVGEGLDG